MMNPDLVLGSRRRLILHRDIMVRRETEMADSRESEKESFWELFSPLQKKLYNFLRKASGFSDESDDLFQEVVLRACRYFPAYDRDRSFSAWLFAIAHNELRRHFKKMRQAAASCTPLSLLAADPPAAGSNPAAKLIRGVADRLPPKKREVFFLFYYNGFSIADIAVITGLTEGNVKFILSRCRDEIRNALEVDHVAG